VYVRQKSLEHRSLDEATVTLFRGGGYSHVSPHLENKHV
jgi:hypothetical protein